MTVPSYSAPGYPAPAQRVRPTVVTVATYLLYLVAALQLISAVIALATYGPLSDAVKEAYAGTDSEGFEVIVTITLVATAVINILIAAGFAILSIFNSRGKNPARVVTWVIGGIALCCVGGGLGSSALTTSLGSEGTTDGPSQAEVQDRISAALPSWYSGISTTISVVVLLAILAAIILLALPASNEFFRKPAAGGWDPVAPYPGYPGGAYPGQPTQPPYPGQYPGHPAQSPYPGQPYPGQQQPGQPYPGQQQPGQPYPGQQQPGQPYSGQPYPGQPYPGQPQPGQPYPGQQQQPGQGQHPGQPPYPGQPNQYGQPGQPAPGLPPYPGQPTPPPASDPFSSPPFTTDPTADRPSSPNRPKSPDDPA